MSFLAMRDEPPVDVSRAALLRGWTSEAELVYLATRAASRANVLELGSFVGRTARAMADNMTGTVWCVDPLDPALRAGHGWRGKADVRLASREEGDRLHVALSMNLADLVAAGRVRILREPPHVAVPRLAREGVRFDMAFIDGDHAYDAVKTDIALCLHAVAPGGLIVGDDYFDDGKHAGVKRAVDETFAGRHERPVGKLWQVRA